MAECDARQLYLAEGYGSLFDFSVGRLRLSGAQAYHRIQAARAARHFPLVLERLRAGRVTMTAVALLREHLTDGNCQKVLDWADGRSKREVELFVRGLDPKPEVPASLRRLASPRAKGLASVAADEPIGPTGAAASTSTLAAGSQVDVSLPLLPAPPVPDVQASPVVTPDERAATGNSALTASPPTSARPLMAGRVEVHPLSPGRYSLRVTISQETHDKLRRAHDLLGHAMPGADLAVVLDRALTLLVARLESRKAGAPAKTRKTVHDEARPKAAGCSDSATNGRGRRRSG